MIKKTKSALCAAALGLTMTLCCGIIAEGDNFLPPEVINDRKNDTEIIAWRKTTNNEADAGTTPLSPVYDAVYDGYYGNNRYTSLPEEYTDDICISDFSIADQNIPGTQLSLTNEDKVLINALVLQYAEANGINAITATIKGATTKLADNEGMYRGEFYIQFDDEKHSIATVVYYPYTETTNRYVDVLPSEFTQDDYDNMIWEAKGDEGSDAGVEKIEEQYRRSLDVRSKKLIKNAQEYLGRAHGDFFEEYNAPLTDLSFIASIIQGSNLSDRRIGSYKQLFGICRFIPKYYRKPGDIVFFCENDKIIHVGILLESDSMIHCGTSVEIVENISQNPYWRTHILSYGRPYFDSTL